MASQQPGPPPNSQPGPSSGISRAHWIIFWLCMLIFESVAVGSANFLPPPWTNILATVSLSLGLMLGAFQISYFQQPFQHLLHRLEAFLNKFIQIKLRATIAGLFFLVLIVLVLSQFLGFFPTLSSLIGKQTLPPSGWSKTYQDPLNTASNSQSTWDISGNGCQFQEQSLVFTAAGPDFCESRAVFLSGNFYLHITLQIATGNEAGVIIDTTQKSCPTGPRIVFFYASITTDGHYKLMYYGCKGETRILTQGSSPAIQQGKNIVNYLGILRLGSKLSLFVNDQSLTSVSSNETQQLKTGRIGLAVTDYFKEKDFTVALFRDVIIYEPESSS